MIANRVFITGGAGFIGSSAADRWLAGGAEVVVYDNFSTGRREFLTARSDIPALRWSKATRPISRR